jgi:hypothetical protein
VRPKTGPSCSALHFLPPPVSSRAPERLEALLCRAHRCALAPSCPCHHWSTVDRVTQPWSTTCGPSPQDFLYRNNLFFRLKSDILQKGPWTFRSSTRGQKNLQSSPWFLKNNSREVHSPRKIHQIVLKTSNHRIFQTATPNSMIHTQKFLESLLLSLFAFIIHMFVAFIYYWCFACTRNCCVRAIR